MASYCTTNLLLIFAVTFQYIVTDLTSDPVRTLTHTCKSIIWFDLWSIAKDVTEYIDYAARTRKMNGSSSSSPVRSEARVYHNDMNSQHFTKSLAFLSTVFKLSNHGGQKGHSRISALTKVRCSQDKRANLLRIIADYTFWYDSSHSLCRVWRQGHSASDFRRVQKKEH